MSFSEQKNLCKQRWKSPALSMVKFLSGQLQISLRISVSGALRLIIEVRNVTLMSHVVGKEFHETNKPFTIDTTFQTVLITTDQETTITITIEIIGIAPALLHAPDLDQDLEIIINLQHFLHRMITKRKLPTQMPLVLLWTSLYIVL